LELNNDKKLGVTLILGLVLVCFLAFRLQAQAPSAPSLPNINLPVVVSKVKIDVKEDCGAKGDGITNDTDAFYKASQLIQQKGGGTLIIPEGTYIVGKQFQEAGQPRYYITAPIFEVKSVNGLLIEGNNAILKMADGLRYGSFDNKTGEPYHPPKMPFYERRIPGYAWQHD
jgi:Endopolygalacturonase